MAGLGRLHRATPFAQLAGRREGKPARPEPSPTSGDTVATNTYDEYGIPGAGNQERFGYTRRYRCDVSDSP